MKPTTALRQADPARQLPQREPDERLLQEILTSDPRSTAPTTAPPRVRAERDWRPLIATAFVGAAVTAIAVIAIRLPAASTSTPAATTTSSRHALENAVFAKLEQVNTGDIPVRQKSATTWTDTSPGGDGGAIDLTDRTLYIAAACDVGGTIAIQVSGHRDQTLDCTTASTLGPINLTAETSSSGGTANLTVTTVSGHHRYVAKSMAFPNSTPTP